MLARSNFQAKCTHSVDNYILNHQMAGFVRG